MKTEVRGENADKFQFICLHNVKIFFPVNQLKCCTICHALKMNGDQLQLCRPIMKAAA